MVLAQEKGVGLVGHVEAYVRATQAFEGRLRCLGRDLSQSQLFRRQLGLDVRD